MRDAATALLGWLGEHPLGAALVALEHQAALVTVLERDLDAARQANALLDAECNALAGDLQRAEGHGYRADT